MDKEPSSSDSTGNRSSHDSVPSTIVGIGASAGGLQALQVFFEAVPADTGMSFVVIIHLDPEQESRLAEILQATTEMPVEQVQDTVSIEPGHVYAIPPGRRLEASDTKLILSDFEEPKGRRAPIDYFFHSLAAREGGRVGIVLSGGGSDGASGVNAIKKAGGLVLVQDPEEAEHNSMPEAAIATGLVDLVLPVGEMATRLPTLKRFSPALPENPARLSEGQEEGLQRALEHVRAEVGSDFSRYKRSTVLRRVKRRMQVRQTERLEDYLSLLQEESDEAKALFDELLIGVSSFFRDPASFEALEKQVIPELLEGKEATDSVRVWVVGCSTGEEAYSVAMLLEEYLQDEYLSVEAPKKEDAPKIQVFASDVDEEGLATAREGRYPRSIEADVPKERLRRFFEEEKGHYRVKQRLQDHVVFAPQNVLRDPPFSRIDLITCRNLLIYLQPEVQQEVFEIFHYALRGQGHLFLGEAETAEASDLFRGLDAEHCLYRAREHTGKRPLLPSLVQGASIGSHGPGVGSGSGTPRSSTRRAGREIVPRRRAEKGRSEERLHREALETGAPPSALVDEEYNVIHLSEQAGRYLRPPKGTLTSKITRLARPALQTELRSALYEAFNEDTQVVTHPVKVQFEGSRLVHMAIRPTESADGEPLALVFFIESRVAEDSPPTDSPNASERAGRQDGKQGGESQQGGGQDTAVVQKLEEELDRTRRQLREVEEEYKSSRQEMVAQNEELRSMNEEYKAATEELETSKKELQSANEELEALNTELEEKLEEVARANSDLKNFMAATDVGMLFLGRELEIRRFTPQIQGYFNIREQDLGRPFGEITHQLKYEGLEQDARAVLEELTPVERKIEGKNGTWYLARLYPYRTGEDKIDGVVTSFVDVTELEEARQKVRELASQLTRVEQQERQRIAHILHDDLQQKLYGCWLKISSLRETLAEWSNRAERDSSTKGELATHAELVEQAEKTEAEIEMVFRELRQLSVGMSPPVLEREGLAATLEWLESYMEEKRGLSVELTTEGEFPVEKEMRVLLFHVTRELLSNVAEHAGVKEAEVQLRKDGGHLVIEVRDQGKGFAPDIVDELRPEDGFGLTAARERIRQFGGNLEIQSAPDEGTRVTIRLPLRETPGRSC